jgi:hypothetical protein
MENVASILLGFFCKYGSVYLIPNITSRINWRVTRVAGNLMTEIGSARLVRGLSLANNSNEFIPRA